MEFSLCPDLEAGLVGAFRGTLTFMSQLVNVTVLMLGMTQVHAVVCHAGVM